MNMEFLTPSYANTSTIFTVDSNTAGASFMFDRRPKRLYKSIGFNSDLTTTTIRLAFPNTVTIDRILIQNCNWKQFTIYTGTTATTFALSGPTAASSWTGNVSADLYLVLASATAITSMAVDITKTISANAEKSIGQFIAAQQLFRFTVNPELAGFKPAVKAKQIVHEMSDGGSVMYRIREKRKYDLSLEYDGTDYKTLESSVYDLNSQFIFAPFPTTSSWNGEAFEMVWTGGFVAGIKPSSAYVPAGYETTLKLEETPA